MVIADKWECEFKYSTVSFSVSNQYLQQLEDIIDDLISGRKNRGELVEENEYGDFDLVLVFKSPGTIVLGKGHFNLEAKVDLRAIKRDLAELRKTKPSQFTYY